MRGGICKPINDYPVWNFYCDGQQPLGSPFIEPTLPGRSLNITCDRVPPVLPILAACQPVEAFIEVHAAGPPYNPIFYRCYWQSAVPSGYDIIQFEWSVTAEFIEWYVKNYYVGGPQPGSVYDILVNIYGITPTSVLGTELYVPLLKVTNHTPNL